MFSRVIRAVFLRGPCFLHRVLGDGGLAVIKGIGALRETIQLGDMAGIHRVDLLAEGIDLLDQTIGGVVPGSDGPCGIVHDPGTLSCGVGGDGLCIVLGSPANDLGFGFRFRQDVRRLPLCFVDHVVARFLHRLLLRALLVRRSVQPLRVLVHLCRDQCHLPPQLRTLPAPLLIFIRHIPQIRIDLLTGIPPQALGKRDLF